MSTMKRTYVRPQILQTASVTLECVFLNSIIEFFFPVETAGAEVDFKYDFPTDDTFNHRWED